MDDTVLQQNQKKESTPHQGPTAPQRRRGARLIFFPFITAACLAALAVYGVFNRSASTAKLEQPANQAAPEQTLSVVKPESLAPTLSLQLPGQTQAYIQAPVIA